MKVMTPLASYFCNDVSQLSPLHPIHRLHIVNMLRSAKAFQPIARYRLTTVQRGFRASRPVRQSPTGGVPNPEMQRYVAVGP